MKPETRWWLWRLAHDLAHFRFHPTCYWCCVACLPRDEQDELRSYDLTSARAFLERLRGR